MENKALQMVVFVSTILFTVLLVLVISLNNKVLGLKEENIELVKQIEEIKKKDDNPLGSVEERITRMEAIVIGLARKMGLKPPGAK